MSLVRDRNKAQVYAAERFAFEGTPLDDSLSEDDITGQYRAVLDSCWWDIEGVRVVPANVRMVNAGGTASARRIQTSAGRQARYVVSHELAHVLHQRVTQMRAEQEGHGPEFRRAHIITVTAIYGDEYGRLLEQGYGSFGLDVAGGLPGAPDALALPIINIDAMSIATAATGGWKRNT